MLAVLKHSWALLFGVLLLLLGNGLQGTLLGIRGALEGFDAATMSLVMSAYYVGFLLGTRRATPMIRRVGHVRVFAALGCRGLDVALGRILGRPGGPKVSSTADWHLARRRTVMRGGGGALALIVCIRKRRGRRRRRRRQVSSLLYRLCVADPVGEGGLRQLGEELDLLAPPRLELDPLPVVHPGIRTGRMRLALGLIIVVGVAIGASMPVPTSPPPVAAAVASEGEAEDEPRDTVLERSPRGHFYAVAEVNGEPIRAWSR